MVYIRRLLERLLRDKPTPPYALRHTQIDQSGSKYRFPLNVQRREQQEPMICRRVIMKPQRLDTTVLFSDPIHPPLPNLLS